MPKMMRKGWSRRDVLRGTAVAAVGLAVPMAGAAQARRRKGERLRVGIVGCGGKGWSGMEWAAEHGDIVALADIDLNNRLKAMEVHPHAASFLDYRDMFSAMAEDMDAVVISTPDHHHYPAAMLAMNAGLHVYGEKPLTRTIWEAREMGRLARAHRVATQMGNQSTAQTPMRQVAALIKKGTFGPAKEVHLWTDRAGGWWKQGAGRPEPKLPPKGIDFDLWLGPRPIRAYGDGYHPFAWRGFWDFGTGALGDMGCHIFNMPFMALDLRDPLAVQATTSGHNREMFPTWSIVKYNFGERKGRAELELHWYDGGKKPPADLAPGFEFGGNGVIVVCRDATIFSPNSDNNEFHLVGGAPLPSIEVEESPGHMAEFARAAMGGPPAVSNFPDYAAPLTETVLLGNLAIWADGPSLEWDARNMKVKGSDEYDALIRPTFERGWGP
ncbi:MAG: Gfo/Idh/MocA family oxidoreductase [Fimbriimonadaceae bacterium]|nr:Gfo/Idh/MocA family oxidoreductase [Fimbriimonadaceae bacterium]